jgi:anti-sigma factor RsiW
MTHLTEATLRTYLDHELIETEQARVRDHLAACAGCRAELAAMEARAGSVKVRLAALAPGGAEAARPARLAWAQFIRKEKPTMFQSLFSRRMRPMWAGITLVAVLAISLSFAPVRALASNFLGLFRVQQVSVLPVDTTRLSALTGHSPLTTDISKMFSDSVTVTREAKEPQAAGSAAEAAQLAGFNVRLPDASAGAPQLTVQNGMAFQFTINRAQAQALIDESGRSDLQLPAAVDGALVKVDVPAGVTASYGTCPKLKGKQADPDQAGSAGRMYPDCVIFAQMPSPTVSTPPELDLAQLAELGLQFTGMTPEQARDYSQTVDWASTLVIPIPQNGATYKQVAVDGVTGYLIQRPADDYPEYALVWVKDGVVYAVGALGADTSKALALANALK